MPGKSSPGEEEEDEEEGAIIEKGGGDGGGALKNPSQEEEALKKEGRTGTADKLKTSCMRKMGRGDNIDRIFARNFL